MTSEQRTVRRGIGRRDPFWEAQLTAVAAIVLYLALPGKLTLGPAWLLPSFEGALVVGLIVASPNPRVRHSRARRRVALGMTALVSGVNLVSLFLLVHYLLKGGNRGGGHALILAGVVLWVTNVLLFALWYWEIDRGGPVSRELGEPRIPDFLFVQMTDERLARGWRPRFVDYLFLSFTNATAFSPTDTMPLTPMAKVLMTVQSLAALVTVSLVVARAVNILS